MAERGRRVVCPAALGSCREFIRQIDPASSDTDVVLGRDTSARLRDLLPFAECPDPVD